MIISSLTQSNTYATHTCLLLITVPLGPTRGHVSGSLKIPAIVNGLTKRRVSFCGYMGQPGPESQHSIDSSFTTCGNGPPNSSHQPARSLPTTYSAKQTKGSRMQADLPQDLDTALILGAKSGKPASRSLRVSSSKLMVCSLRSSQRGFCPVGTK